MERCDRKCSLYPVCRYRSFIRKVLSLSYDFQIANHNLVLADVLSRKNGRNRMFPPSGVIIFDEAHKLLDAARQMYGMTLENAEMERLLASIYHAIGGNNPDTAEIVKLCEEALLQNTLLFEALKKGAGISYDKNCYAVQIDLNCILALKALMAVLRRLSVLFYTTSREKRERYDRLVSRMEKQDEKLSVLLHYPQSILWMELTGAVSCRVCALPKQLDYLLLEDIWSENMPYILTSATLSVGGDFSHFKRAGGIAMTEQRRIFETSKASPFDYQENALLYLPLEIPSPNAENSGYFQSVVEHLEKLSEATHGHTLILFTSYRLMEQVHTELSRRITNFPLFCMGRGRLDALDNFRKSGNGILFASDSAGEGIDLAGDILSSLIVVRLLFPVPDPMLEYEKTLYPDFYTYLNQVIVPGMLIKLRQWIGRGIRRESDTCVFSILDSRANHCYKDDITDYDCYVDGIYNVLGEYESLDELNYLANKIEEMDQSEFDRFEAAIGISDYDRSVQDLINLADNLDKYEVYPDIHDHDDLGRMYIEEYGAMEVPDHLKNYIDYEAYGRDIALDEIGHFTDQGYVRDNGDSFTEYYDGSRKNIPEEYCVMTNPNAVEQDQDLPEDFKTGEMIETPRGSFSLRI